jgi:hypothetical protein
MRFSFLVALPATAGPNSKNQAVMPGLQELSERPADSLPPPPVRPLPGPPVRGR